MVRNYHWKYDLPTSNLKTGVISAEGVLASWKRSQNLQAGNMIVVIYHVGSYDEQLLFQPSSEYSKVPAAVRVRDIIGPDTTDTLECLAVITVI